MNDAVNTYLGSMKFMGEDADKNFLVRVEIVRSGPNRNGWDFQNMETLGKTFLGTPLLCAYVGRQIGDGHNFRETVTVTGEEILDFTGPTAERIVGSISDDPADLWTEEREDGTWVVANGKIWAFYNRQLVDKLALQGGMAVSAEIETYGGYTNEEGIEVYDRWQGMGVTLLHESVPPAVPGANIRAIRAMSEEFKEMKLRAASYHPNQENETVPGDEVLPPEPDHNPTEKGVRHHMAFNKREAERLAEKFTGYTVVGLSEDSKTVALMSENNALYSYTFSEEYGEDGVVASAIQPLTAITVLCGSEDAPIYADIDAILHPMAETISQQNATISNLNAQISTLTEKNGALEKLEHDRRVEMVKASVQKALADICESCDNAETCDNEANAIMENAEDYAAMEDGGKFCGADKAYEKLMSVFAEKVVKARKTAAENKKSRFAWDSFRNGGAGGGSDGLSGLIARLNNGGNA